MYNPYKYHLNSVYYIEGNPGIKPEFSNTLEFIIPYNLFVFGKWSKYSEKTWDKL